MIGSGVTPSMVCASRRSLSGFTPTTCSFQGTAFLLRIDPLKRLNCSLAQVQEIWIVAETLERFVERHGACAEVAERAPATAVRGVEQHDLVAVAGQAQPRQRFPGAAREQAVEPPRVFRRLQLLRGWSHDEASSPVFPRGPRPRGSDGPGPPRRASLAIGGDPLDCREDRLLGRDTASLGAAGRA